MKLVSSDFFELKVALLGNVSAGKSTVLNGLLRSRYSEVAMNRTTAAVNYFRLFQKPDDGTADWQNTADNPRTAESTLEEITKDNRTKLTPTNSSVQEKFFDVELDRNLIRMRADTRLVLIDIPGLNEAGTDHYKKFVSERWHTFDCVVLIMDGKHGVNTQDQVFLLNFVKNNLTTIKEVPVIILCNKVDDPEDEEMSGLVDERTTIENIFGVGCRKQALQQLLEKDKNSGSFLNASPAFLPISAINAYIQQSASQMGIEKFQTFEKDLIDKLGREQFGRLRWNKLSDKEKVEEVFNIVTDPEACNEVLGESNFSAFLDTLDYFLGGESKQLALLHQQVNSAAKKLANISLEDGQLSNQLWTMYKQWMKLYDSQQKPAQSRESFCRGFVLRTASALFWSRFAKWESLAFESFSSSWENDRPRCSYLARPLNELIAYFVFVRATGVACEETEKVLTQMKQLVCRYLDEILDRYVGTQSGFHDAIVAEDPGHWMSLNPYDWSLIFRSVLLHTRDEIFCDEFASQIVLMQTYVPDTQGWIAHNFRAQEKVCHVCEAKLVPRAPVLGLFSLQSSASASAGVGLFRQQAPAPTAFVGPSAFGFTAPFASGAPGPGTRAAQYQMTTQQDGATSITLYSISAMPQFHNKSHEELRHEDYFHGDNRSSTPFRTPKPEQDDGAPGGFGVPGSAASGVNAKPQGFGAPVAHPVAGGADSFRIGTADKANPGNRPGRRLVRAKRPSGSQPPAAVATSSGLQEPSQSRFSFGTPAPAVCSSGLQESAQSEFSNGSSFASPVHAPSGPFGSLAPVSGASVPGSSAGIGPSAPPTAFRGFGASSNTAPAFSSEHASGSGSLFREPAPEPSFMCCPNGHKSSACWKCFDSKGNGIVIHGSASFGAFCSCNSASSKAYFPLHLLKVTHTATEGAVPQYPEAHSNLVHISIPASISDPSHFGHLPWLYCQFKALLQENGPGSQSARFRELFSSLGLESIEQEAKTMAGVDRSKKQVATACFAMPTSSLPSEKTESRELSTFKSKTEIKVMLISFFQEKNPEKVSDIDNLLQKYEGREETMLRKLAQKYDVNPAVFGLSVSAPKQSASPTPT